MDRHSGLVFRRRKLRVLQLRLGFSFNPRSESDNKSWGEGNGHHGVRARARRVCWPSGVSGISHILDPHEPNDYGVGNSGLP